MTQFRRCLSCLPCNCCCCLWLYWPERRVPRKNSMSFIDTRPNTALPRGWCWIVVVVVIVCRLPGNWLSTKLEFMKNVSQILQFYTSSCSVGIIRNRRRVKQAGSHPKCRKEETGRDSCSCITVYFYSSMLHNVFSASNGLIGTN